MGKILTINNSIRRKCNYF